MINKITTANIAACTAVYVRAAEAAREATKAVLREASALLVPHVVGVGQASHAVVLFRTAWEHTKCAVAKGWCLPTVPAHDDSSEDGDAVTRDRHNSRRQLQLVGVTPYWMDRHMAVSNTVTLEGMLLLTSANGIKRSREGGRQSLSLCILNMSDCYCDCA